MSTGTYWDRTIQSRLTRRRALAGAAVIGTGAAALSLVGCGGGKKEEAKGPSGPKDTSGLLSYPEDTTAKAKSGGTYKIALQTDLTTFDPLTTSSFTTQYYIAYYAYPRFLKYKSAAYPNSPTAEVEGDLAESFEISPDKLQITMKLRQGAKWDSRAPTSNRIIDSEDVKFSFDKFASVSPFRGELVYNATTSPSAPVESISTPDARTVVVKLKKPDASSLQLLAAGSIFFIMPRESESKFDPKGEVRGYGPWQLDKYERDTLFTWTKNPNWYGKVYPDKVEVPVIKEYAQQLAQFKAGNIYGSTWVGTPNQTDMLQTQKDVPATKLYQGVSYTLDPHKITFGWQEGSPFRDERMRKAVSMITDRELVTDFTANRPNFTKIGLPVPTKYHNAVAAGWEGYWLDPTSEKDMPGLTQYFKYNVAEAKKLMAAAGFANGVDTDGIYMSESFYGAQYTKNAELYLNMFNEGGVRAKAQGKLYTTEYLTPNYYYAYSPTGRDKTFKGLVILLDRTYPTVPSQLFATDHSDGPRFHGMTTNGLNPEKGDPQINSLIEKMQGEFDLKKQQAIAQEYQRYLVSKMYYVPGGPYPTATLSFSLSWPAVANYATLSSIGATGVWWVEAIHNYWIDDTKAPLGKS